MFDQAFGERLGAVEYRELRALEKEPPPLEASQPALAAYVAEQLDMLADEDPELTPEACAPGGADRRDARGGAHRRGERAVLRVPLDCGALPAPALGANGEQAYAGSPSTNSVSARLNASGFSMFERWPAPRDLHELRALHRRRHLLRLGRRRERVLLAHDRRASGR